MFALTFLLALLIYTPLSAQEKYDPKNRVPVLEETVNWEDMKGIVSGDIEAKDYVRRKFWYLMNMKINCKFLKTKVASNIELDAHFDGRSVPGAHFKTSVVTKNITPKKEKQISFTLDNIPQRTLFRYITTAKHAPNLNDLCWEIILNKLNY